MLFLDNGVRLSELTNRSVDDVDLDMRVMRIQLSEGEQLRTSSGKGRRDQMK